MPAPIPREDVFLRSWVTTWPYHRLTGVMLLMAVFTVISACGDEEPTPTATATSRPAAVSTATPTPMPTPIPVGKLEVRVTDLPNLAITAIDLTVDNIEVHRSSDGEWTTVVEGPGVPGRPSNQVGPELRGCVLSQQRRRGLLERLVPASGSGRPVRYLDSGYPPP